MSNELLKGSSAAIVRKTESELGISILPKIDSTLAEGSRALIQDMKSTNKLVILLKPDRKDHQYLIAQACFSALASKNHSFHLQSTPGGQDSFAKELASRGLENAQAIASHLTNGTGSQLRGAPLLALSAQSIYSNHPELREDQLNYFKLDCAEGELALSQAPKEFAGVLVDAHLALNGAVALVADYLFGNTEFYNAYKGTSTDTLSTNLVEDLYGVEAKKKEMDIVQSWIVKLSLGDFFTVVRE